ncbi:hypothetical protein GCM10011335_21260 [Aureimonas glaciei]|uniref:Uncharacterized protein n=1 Tax=Aureimonas glaciei TaxID=1776957 RepID=A0A916XX05_9HYPH|nr:hypothetical protein GCM10011335_21260 [Aureimonas glaciei]
MRAEMRLESVERLPRAGGGGAENDVDGGGLGGDHRGDPRRIAQPARIQRTLMIALSRQGNGGMRMPQEVERGEEFSRHAIS